MERRTCFWVGNGVLAVLCVLSILWQSHRSENLRAEVEGLRSRAHDYSFAKEQQRELLATRVSTAELQSLRQDHEAFERLSRELSDLKDKANDRITSASHDASSIGPEPVWPNAEPEIPATAWANLGRNNPLQMIETNLWAAAGGDIELLSAGLTMGVDEDGEIRKLLAELSPGERSLYRTPEQFVAALMVKEVAPASIQLLDQSSNSPKTASLTIRLKSADGTSKDAVFRAYHAPDGWRLFVPRAAVLNYVAMIRGSQR